MCIHSDIVAARIKNMTHSSNCFWHFYFQPTSLPAPSQHSLGLSVSRWFNQERTERISSLVRKAQVGEGDYQCVRKPYITGITRKVQL